MSDSFWISYKVNVRCKKVMTFSRYRKIYRTCAHKKINIEKKEERNERAKPFVQKINKKAKRRERESMEWTEYIVRSKVTYQALFALLFLEMTRVLRAPLARLVARCWPCSIHPVVGTTCRLRDRMHTRNYAIVSIYTIGDGEVPFILSEGIPSVRPSRSIHCYRCLSVVVCRRCCYASDFHPHYSTISPSSGIIIRSVGNVTVLHCWKAVPPRTEEHHSTSGVAAQGWRTGCGHWI